jgi:membrane fusion protein (multidrug efflux system)
VSSDLVQITSEVAGTVIAVHVDDTQHVDRGQPLLELDPADAEVAMASAEAELARSVRSVRGVFSQAEGIKAQINERQVALNAARADLKRRQMSSGDGSVSDEELQHARDQVAQLSAALNVSNESLTTTQAQITGTQIESNPQVLAAAAKVREVALSLKRTKINAPVAGVVARRGVQIGSRIAAGTPLLAVVPLDQAWVDANFKEVQLPRMRIGQPVELHADLYGGDVTYHGKVAGLGAGSGSAFALLPAQNASGNWIKIVQRVPVRIALDPQELAAHPLRVGLSMKVDVDLHDTSGSLVATTCARPQRSVMSEEHDNEIDAKIARIIADNAGLNGDAARSRRAMSGPGSNAAPGASAPPALPPVKGSHALVATALAIGTFMQVLDTTIANVSIPTISGNLGVSSDQGTWVITSFAVANGISVPLTGWLMQRFGVVKVFVLSVLAFTVASFLCGVAWSLSSLIMFRVMQGAVSGPMIPGSQALLMSIFPATEKRHGAGDLVDDDAGRADLRADLGRPYFRQLFVAVDLSDQRAGRPVLRVYLLGRAESA